jgi:cold shock CspA family protein
MAALGLGTVSDFDERLGLGTVDLDDGRRLSFHATAIADGTRSILVGTPVAVEVRADHGGRFEAAVVSPR